MGKCPNTLCFISSKGGSGKTVTASALGVVLSSLGLRVLLIDTDASTNGMTLLFLEHMLQGSAQVSNRRGIGLFESSDDFIATKIEINQGLDFIPAAYHLKNTENFGVNSFKYSLKEVLSRTDSYDVVLIDAQAGTDGYAQVAAGMSESHIIVSEYDPVSAQGIDRLKLIFSNEISTTSTYTLFNKVLPEFASIIGEGLAIARYLPPVPWDADVVRAFARRDLAIMMDAPNPYTLAISQVALACLPEVAGEPIEQWRQSVLNKTTDPIKDRLNKLTYAKEQIAHKQKRAMLATALVKAAPLTAGAILFVYVGIADAVQGTAALLAKHIDTGFIATSAGMILGIVALTILTDFHNRRSNNSRGEIAELDVEIDQLKTAMMAAESTLKVTPPGPFEQHRRRMRV